MLSILQEEEIAAVLGMAVRQVTSITEEIRELTVETLMLLQMILTMLVHAEMVQQKALEIQIMAAIIILVLREQVAQQTILGQTEAVTLLQEVRQIVGREVHQRHLQVHQTGEEVRLRAVEHQEARQVVAVAEAAVGQDN